ncbi:MAG: hypothetical protein H6765_09640 [Candidatus Peribacteria bacterium]|nr:MAG: hypothetical protein H6765_09640 [Candidatus Peribacteria bacterium]
MSWAFFWALAVLIYFNRETLQNSWQIIDESMGTMSIGQYHPVWNVLISLPFLAYGIQSILTKTPILWSHVCLVIGGLLVVYYIHHALSTHDWGVKQVSSGKFWLSAFALVLLCLSCMYLDM